MCNHPTCYPARCEVGRWQHFDTPAAMTLQEGQAALTAVLVEEKFPNFPWRNILNAHTTNRSFYHGGGIRCVKDSVSFIPADAAATQLVCQLRLPDSFRFQDGIESVVVGGAFARKEDATADACMRMLALLLIKGVERVTMPCKAFIRGNDSIREIYRVAWQRNTRLLPILGMPWGAGGGGADAAQAGPWQQAPAADAPRPLAPPPPPAPRRHRPPPPPVPRPSGSKCDVCGRLAPELPVAQCEVCGVAPSRHHIACCPSGVRGRKAKAEAISRVWRAEQAEAQGQAAAQEAHKHQQELQEAQRQMQLQLHMVQQQQQQQMAQHQQAHEEHMRQHMLRFEESQCYQDQPRQPRRRRWPLAATAGSSRSSSGNSSSSSRCSLQIPP